MSAPMRTWRCSGRWVGGSTLEPASYVGRTAGAAAKAYAEAAVLEEMAAGCTRRVVEVTVEPGDLYHVTVAVTVVGYLSCPTCKHGTGSSGRGRSAPEVQHADTCPRKGSST